MIDKLDRAILSILQENARTSNVEVARRVGLAPSAVLERIRKLERGGVIRGYEPRLNTAAVGSPLVAFIFVHADEKIGGLETGRKIARFPEGAGGPSGRGRGRAISSRCGWPTPTPWGASCASSSRHSPRSAPRERRSSSRR